MVCNHDNIIDSRDIIERIKELTALKDTLEEARATVAEAKAYLEEVEAAAQPGDTDPSVPDAEDTLEAVESALIDAEVDFGEDEQQELASLEALESEASGS
jgi:hypothetical protein